MRALPHILFALLSVLCFRGFLFGGGTLYDVQTLDRYLGKAPRDEPAGFFRPPPFGRADTLTLLPFLHRNYAEGLKAGELRLWNPMLFCGCPAYSDPMLHPFYPPHLVLHFLLPPAAAYEVTLLLHLYFAGAAMYWLLCGMGRSRAAATFGALVWMFWGYHALWFSTEVLAGVSVFLPLAMLALVKSAERRSLSLAALGGASMGLVVLGSHPQHALLAFLFVLAWQVTQVLRSREHRGHALRAILLFGWVMVLVGMPAILTRLDSIATGLRVPKGEFGLLYPGLGVMLHIADIAIGKASFMTTGHARSEFMLYAGFAATALAVAGAVRGWRDPVIRFVAVAAAVLMGVVFVRPLAAAAHSIWFLNLSQPTRWVVVIGFCVPLLAANGFDALKERPGRTAWILCGATVLFLAIGFAALPILPVVETAIGMALAIGAAFALRPAPRLAMGLCFSAVLFDLLPGFLAYNRHRDPAPLGETPEVLAKIAGTETEPTRAVIGWGIRDGKPVKDYLPAQFNNLLALYGVEAAAGYEAIAPEIMAGYCVLMEGGAMAGGRSLYFGLISPEMDGFHRLSATHVLLRSGLDPPTGCKRVGTWGPFTVYRNPGAGPRAYLADRFRHHLGHNNNLYSGDHVVLLSLDRAARYREFHPKLDGGLRWIERTSDRQVFQVTNSTGIMLVVADAWYPGWVADVDGEEVKIELANDAFRAVWVPGGEHRVTFRFRPPGSGLAWLLSLLVLFGASGWALAAGRRKSPATS